MSNTKRKTNPNSELESDKSERQIKLLAPNRSLNIVFSPF